MGIKFQKFPFKIEKQYRLKGWNYSDNGYYFMTVCCKDRENLLRSVGTDLCVCSYKKKNIGDLTDFGKMCEEWWNKIENKFKNVKTDEYMVMPNHVHGILVIDNKNLYLEQERMKLIEERTRGSVPTEENDGSVPTGMFGHVGLLGQMIRWFKTMTTNEYIKGVKKYNWSRFSKRIWQTRFHDRIIRNEKEYWAIKQYIKNNPKNWLKDKEYKMV